MNKKTKYGPKEGKEIPYFERFLKRFSERNRPLIRNKVIFFSKVLYIKFKIRNILKADYDQIEFFLDYINNRPIIRNNKITDKTIALVTKEKWRSVINSYFSFIEKLSKKKGGFKFTNRTPDSDLYLFDREKRFLVDITSNRKINYEEATRILSYYYFRGDFKDIQTFIIVSLLLYTGARIHELMTLLIENMSLDGRFVFNLIKRTTKVDKYGIYFFPEFFVKDLKIYMELKKREYPDNPFLFPAPRHPGAFLSDKAVRSRLHDTCKFLNITSEHTPHKFRALLNDARKKKGAAPIDRSALLMHKLPSVEAEHYLKSLKEVIELREIYDITFPFKIFKPNPNYLTN